MKRVKRDKTNRAYSRGYQAGLQVRSRDLCPYTDTTTRQFWLSGWRDGRADHWAGFTGVSGIHRTANHF